MSVEPKPYSDDPLRRVVGSALGHVYLSCGHILIVEGRAPLPRERCRRCGELEEAAPTVTA